MAAPAKSRPPIHTLTVELVGWTLQRTADIPKSQRFTFGQRLDGQTLDALEVVVRAIFAPTGAKAELLQDLNVRLEILRALWRLVHDQRWISAQQLVFVIGRIDEIGRMTGGWLRQLPSGKAT
jgi:hypothetical protein